MMQNLQNKGHANITLSSYCLV